MKKWQTKDQLVDLLCSLVEYPSITGSSAEIALAEFLYYQLAERSYFHKNPEHLKLHPLKDGRQLLTALVKNDEKKDTVILLSHFDVVGVDDYGSRKNLAFHPRELTSEYYKYKDELPDQVQADLEHGDWLFGRGTMDMKAGLSLHLSMLEKALYDEFDGNILLVTVPDEEVNSLGMLTALPALEQIREQENLTYRACLNGEPMFSRYPGDENFYIYTGSIGKVLPGFFCYGKETHVGEPFAGLNANLMISYLAKELELNESFIEKTGDEVTPPPVSLMLRDLKEEYSVQTPQAAVSMYNVLYLKQSMDDITEKLLLAANRAGKQITNHYQEKAEIFRQHTNNNGEFPKMDVRVIMYQDLYDEAVSRYGKHEVERRQNLLISQRGHGDREFSTLLVQDLAFLCKDLAPMIVLFFSPPFYPSVSSNDDPYIQYIVEHVKEYTKQRYHVPLQKVEYFTGLSDLSFVGPSSAANSNLTNLTKNMPLNGKGFDFPEDIIEALTMPILNVGPLGRDAHQWTERLELTYSFEMLPDILTSTIKELLEKE